jgi:membrane fusion protein (multidrug efflux system)
MHRTLLVLLSLSLLLFSCKEKESSTGNDKTVTKEAPALKVNGLIAGEQILSDQLTATGTILANEEVEVKSEISGKITDIYFKEGSVVQKGQILLKLNDDDLQAQMKKLKIELKLLDVQESRQKQLLSASAISKEEYDMTKTNLDLLKANMDILQIELDKTKIASPTNGIIGLKYVSPGSFINSSTNIATIQNVNPLKLEFSIPEKYNALIKAGSKILFTTAGSSQQWNATVYAKEPKIDATTRSTKVRATFSNKGSLVMPGSFADVRVPLGEKTRGIMIPTIAFIPDIQGAKVFLCKGGKAVSASVTAGIRTDKEIQIVDGIQPGDTVITSGILLLKPDAPVSVIIEKPVR